MKTCIVTTCFLDVPEYFEKTAKFVQYYYGLSHHMPKGYPDIILFDNASKFENIGRMMGWLDYGNCYIQRFMTHIPRKSHLEYGYLWRAVYNLQYLFKDYDKIIYCDNDFYINQHISPLKMLEFVDSIDQGWHTFYCNKHNFPETGCHVIHKNNTTYNNFVAGLTEEEFIKKYNGTTMELTLPIENVHKEFKGDRYSEYPMTTPNDADFAAQVTLDQQV